MVLSDGDIREGGIELIAKEQSAQVCPRGHGPLVQRTGFYRNGDPGDSQFVGSVEEWYCQMCHCQPTKPAPSVEVHPEYRRQEFSRKPRVLKDVTLPVAKETFDIYVPLYVHQQRVTAELEGGVNVIDVKVHLALMGVTWRIIAIDGLEKVIKTFKLARERGIKPIRMYVLEQTILKLKARGIDSWRVKGFAYFLIDGSVADVLERLVGPAPK